jgi:hypothetical protein
MTTTALREKIFNRGNKRPRGPISFLHAALASGSPGMIEFGPRRGPLRRIMRKVIVGVATVRLRLWLCLWVWLIAIATYIASLTPKGRPNQR